jgi:hypothetical protein
MVREFVHDPCCYTRREDRFGATPERITATAKAQATAPRCRSDIQVVLTDQGFHGFGDQVMDRLAGLDAAADLAG